LSNIAFDRDFIEKLVLDQVTDLGVASDAVKLTAQLDGLGLDSLDIVELSQQVRRELGISLSAKDFAETVTVNDVVEVIVDRAGTA